MHAQPVPSWAPSTSPTGMNTRVRTLISSRSTMSCMTKGGAAAMVARERRWRIMDKRLGRAENECGCPAKLGAPATSEVRAFAVSMESGGPRRCVLIGARWGSGWEAELVELSWDAAGGAVRPVRCAWAGGVLGQAAWAGYRPRVGYHEGPPWTRRTAFPLLGPPAHRGRSAAQVGGIDCRERAMRPGPISTPRQSALRACGPKAAGWPIRHGMP